MLTMLVIADQIVKSNAAMATWLFWLSWCTQLGSVVFLRNVFLLSYRPAQKKSFHFNINVSVKYLGTIIFKQQRNASVDIVKYNMRYLLYR